MWKDKAIGDMSMAAGETVSLNARIAGEMLRHIDGHHEFVFVSKKTGCF